MKQKNLRILKKIRCNNCGLEEKVHPHKYCKSFIHICRKKINLSKIEKMFDKEFPKIMAKNKVKNFPREAFIDIKKCFRNNFED
jgi:hypothetical protein